MAAPMVTGAVALVEAAHPSWTMSQVIDAILDTVTPDPSLAGEVTTGGVLNAGAAVANTDGPYVVSATPDGSINTTGGFSTVQLTFNEEINPATFTSVPGHPHRTRRRHPRRRLDVTAGERLERSRVPDLVPIPVRRRHLQA